MENNELISNGENLRQKRMAAHDLESLDSASLSDYIVQTHHQYAKTVIPKIQNLIDTVFVKHGLKYPELKQIKTHFLQFSSEFQLHMRKEELVLFPYFNQLVEAKLSGNLIDTPVFGSVKLPLSVMDIEHETSTRMQKKLFSLTNGYSAPEDASEAFIELFAELKEFNDDLKQHVHIEDDVLFPKAMELEQGLLAD